MWFHDAVFYQIYPLGLCGAPLHNDDTTQPRITRLEQWVPHIKKLGASAVYFSPVFQSDSHGYDTRNYLTLDCRLGTNADFAKLCALLHQNGIRVVLDGVFNHVGRGFWAFRDLQQNRENSPYRDWFQVNFGGNSCYNDGFWYEGWEGHYELVKLNLRNPAVAEHIHQAIRAWVEQFDIDGLRLDVAYCLDRDFLRGLRRFCDGLKPEFLLLGETLFGDYGQLVNDELLHSCTNYENYKSLYSSFNDLNLFEISYSLNRQFGREQWCIYRGKHLLSFADNHDVSRIASILKEKRHLPLIYGMLFTMPGVPCVYYGSEWGIEGDKKDGDNALRPALTVPEENDLTHWIVKLAALRRDTPALCHGDYANLHVQNKQLVFERGCGNQRVAALLNADGGEYVVRGCQGRGNSLLTGQAVDLGSLTLAPYSFDCVLLES